jgi:uncharacterized protein (TIGR00725 family)
MPPAKKTPAKSPAKRIRLASDDLRYKICVSGAAETGLCSEDCYEKAVLLGKEIARRGMVLVTGATSGVPYWVAKAVKEEGGVVVGFSPAISKKAHVNTYHLPLDYHDVVMYTGFHYSGRNLLLMRSADAIITICGRIGTLNEFTIGFEDKKPIGVLEGTGGMADRLRDIVENAHRGPGRVVFSRDPKELLDEVVKLIETSEADDIPKVVTMKEKEGEQ